MADRVKLLIVDDSRLFRSALEDALRNAPEVEIVGSVFSGAKALEFLRASAGTNVAPDLLTLDVEMPEMNGLETLRQVQALNEARAAGGASVGVIMLSAFTRRGERVTIESLQAGAFDFVPKPTGSAPGSDLAALRDELISKIRAFAASRRGRGLGAAPTGVPSAAPTAHVNGTLHGRVVPVSPPSAAAARRTRVRAIVIGTSTGGPRALSEMLPGLCRLTDLPILIVQHMPPSFTATLADLLARQTGRLVVEASEGLTVQRGTVYIAPGGKHMIVRGGASAPVVALNELPPENGCRPSADVLFRSAATVFGGELIAVILTGMGRDGTAGLGTIRRAGGHVIAQDEATSVVWGMPGSAVEAGVVDQIVPLDAIPGAAAAVVAGQGGRSAGTP